MCGVPWRGPNDDLCCKRRKRTRCAGVCPHSALYLTSLLSRRRILPLQHFSLAGRTGAPAHRPAPSTPPTTRRHSNQRRDRRGRVGALRGRHMATTY
eukprot:3407623-Prymnesium_polylepis.1